jgi:hypothetical protein
MTKSLEPLGRSLSSAVDGACPDAEYEFELEKSMFVMRCT